MKEMNEYLNLDDLGAWKDLVAVLLHSCGAAAGCLGLHPPPGSQQVLFQVQHHSSVEECMDHPLLIAG